jgi:hypothetical protein
MKGTLKRYGHKSHLKAKAATINKAARLFYEKDEKRLQKKIYKDASLVQ